MGQCAIIYCLRCHRVKYKLYASVPLVFVLLLLFTTSQVPWSTPFSLASTSFNCSCPFLPGIPAAWIGDSSKHKRIIFGRWTYIVMHLSETVQMISFSFLGYVLIFDDNSITDFIHRISAGLAFYYSWKDHELMVFKIFYEYIIYVSRNEI